MARELHPEIAERVFVADLSQPLSLEDGYFDFVGCNAVVQHIEPDLARVLRPGGVLQLMLKNWTGVRTVFDKDYGVERTFRLYDEHELMGVLQELGMMLIEGKAPEELGGFMYFTDTKLVDHCLFFARKRQV